MQVRRLFRPSIRNVVFALFGMYLCVVVLFYSGIQKSHSLPNQDSNVVVRSDVVPGVPGEAPRKSGQLEGNDLPLYIKQRSSKFTPKYKGMKEDNPGYMDPIRRLEPKSWDHQHDLCVGSNTGREFDFIEVISKKLFVYSAYWDTRPNDFDNKHNGTFVRIMSVMRSGWSKLDVSCKMYTKDGDVKITGATYYEMCENHGRQLGGFILSCPVPPEIGGQPCSVVVFETKSDQPVSSLKVLSLTPKEDLDQFAICVPPLYGNINERKLVEFVEMSRLLGVQRIVFYDYQITEETAKILEHYQDKIYVDVIPWLYPDILEKSSWYHGQLIAIQDCLYRNMHNAKYLVFNDIDEYIVPHEHEDWAQLVEHSFQPGQCALQFRSSFFPPSDSNTNDTTVLSATRRTTYFSSIRTKCMVKPSLIFEKGIHHISKPIWAHLKVKKVPENTAFLHHYRKCMTDFGMNCRDFMEDNIMLKHTKSFSSNIERTLKHVRSKGSWRNI